jgi:hypothetical protein
MDYQLLFWKYASEFKGSADIEEVFKVFASANQIHGISRSLLWQNISNDIDILFNKRTRHAGITIDPDGRIHINNDSADTGDVSKQEGISDNAEEIKKDVTDTQPAQHTEVNSKRTIFDSLQ